MFSFVSADLTTDIKSYWKFDGNAIDSVGSNDGTVTGATYTASGKINKAYDFDGINDYISFSDFGSVKSFSIWIKPDVAITTSSGGSGIFEFDGTHNAVWLGFFTGAFSNELITLTTSGSTDNYFYWDTSDIGVSSITTDWHLISFVWSSADSNYHLYYNGVDCGLGNTFGSPVELDFNAPYFGRRGTSYFNGILDEPAIWNRALTSTEISELYNSGTGLQYPFEGVSNFKITAQDKSTNTSLNNFEALVDGTYYNTSTGSIVTDINTTEIIDIYVWSEEEPGYTNTSFLNWNTSTNLDAELYKKNSISIQTYWENGTIINNQTFNVRFTSDIPTTFTTTTNSSGYLLENDLAVAEWEVEVFNENFTKRRYYVDVRDFSFNVLNVHFPLPENQEEKTFIIKDNLGVAIEGAVMTLTKLINDSYITLAQLKTDSTGTDTEILNNGFLYRLIIEAENYQTKVFGLNANSEVTEYNIRLLTQGELNFSSITDDFSYNIQPNTNQLQNGPNNLNITLSSPKGALEWFYIAANGSEDNVTGSPAGGTAILNLNLNSSLIQKLDVLYLIKVAGYENPYQIKRVYAIYNSINSSTSLSNVKDDFSEVFETNTGALFASFVIVILVLIFSFLFSVDNVSGTKNLNGIPLLLGTGVFFWFGAFPLTISIMVMFLIGLSIIGGVN